MMTVVFLFLLAFAGLLTILVAALASDFHSSDAAGNGMAQGFAFLGAIVFWVVVGILLLLCGARAGFSAVRVVAVVAALAFAITSQFMAMALLEDMRSGDRFENVLVVGVGAIALVAVLYAGWAFFPGVRDAVPPKLAHTIAGVALAGACSITWIAMGPVQATNLGRIQAWEAERATDEALAKQVQALPADTALGSFLEYTDIPPEKDSEASRAALARMQAMPDKQAAAEEALAKADTRVLRVLRNLEVKATPALCVAGKTATRKLAEELKPTAARATFDDVESWLNVHMDGVEWLNENGCDVKAEVGAVEQAIRLYPETYPRQWSLDHLGELQGRPRQP